MKKTKIAYYNGSLELNGIITPTYLALELILYRLSNGKNMIITPIKEKQSENCIGIRYLNTTKEWVTADHFAIEYSTFPKVAKDDTFKACRHKMRQFAGLYSRLTHKTLYFSIEHV